MAKTAVAASKPVQPRYARGLAARWAAVQAATYPNHPQAR